MTTALRYAVYHLTSVPALAAFAAGWLGWDSVTGRDVASPDLPDLPLRQAELTAEPRRYGFHATLKAPFRLAAGEDIAGLDAALAALAATQPPVALSGLALTRISAFLALTPEAPSAALHDLAARCVEDLDRFRAPLTADEVARRRPDRLTPAQRGHLDRWGYPHVMEEFRFHMTLTGPLAPDIAAAVTDLLAPRIAPLLPRPYPVDAICLLGEGEDRRFRLLRRYALTASPAI